MIKRAVLISLLFIAAATARPLKTIQDSGYLAVVFPSGETSGKKPEGIVERFHLELVRGVARALNVRLKIAYLEPAALLQRDGTNSLAVLHRADLLCGPFNSALQQRRLAEYIHIYDRVPVCLYREGTRTRTFKDLSRLRGLITVEHLVPPLMDRLREKNNEAWLKAGTSRESLGILLETRQGYMVLPSEEASHYAEMHGDLRINNSVLKKITGILKCGWYVHVDNTKLKLALENHFNRIKRLGHFGKTWYSVFSYPPDLNELLLNPYDIRGNKAMRESIDLFLSDRPEEALETFNKSVDYKKHNARMTKTYNTMFLQWFKEEEAKDDGTPNRALEHYLKNNPSRSILQVLGQQHREKVSASLNDLKERGEIPEFVMLPGEQAAPGRPETPDMEITEGVGSVFIVIPNVIFNMERSRFDRIYYTSLNKVITMLKKVFGKYPDAKVHIGAHTDQGSDPTYNINLTQVRGNAILDYILLNAAFNANSFTVRGYGSEKPLSSNETPEGRRKNRRIEFKITY